MAERGDQGVHLVVTDRLAEPVMTKAGYAKVSEVPPLSREERRSLRRIEADLRHRYDRGDFRLGGLAGLSLDKGRQASGELFDENQVEALAFAGDLDGKPPPVDLMRKFSELRRRARPETAFIVWRAPH